MDVRQTPPHPCLQIALVAYWTDKIDFYSSIVQHHLYAVNSWLLVNAMKYRHAVNCAAIVELDHVVDPPMHSEEAWDVTVR